MPFYSNSGTPVPQQQGVASMVESGFAPPIRDRYPNSVWHPTAATDPNGKDQIISSQLATHSLKKYFCNKITFT